MASKINADEFVDREGEGKPTLPKGVVLSGVTTITTAVVAENEVANSTGINAGIITSTHFAGNLTGDVNAGIVTVTSQSVIGSAVTISASGIDIGAGVITATSYAGSGANLTGIGATIMVWEYNPDPYASSVSMDTGIGITFNQKIKAGSGNITLSIANAGVAGTVVENFGIGSSVTIIGNSLSIDPTSDLSEEGGQYCITLPSGVITNMAGDNYVGTAYTFEARTYDRELWNWGYNLYGKLGHNQGPASEYSSPVQLPGTDWVKGVAGQGMLFFVKSNGTLWGAGRNNFGQLGQNSITSPATSGLSSPVQIPGTTWSTGDRKFNSSSYNTTHGIKTDGTLWSWGSGNIGQGGYNDILSRSSPTQIPGTTWSKVSGGQAATAAIKTDGTLWSWGGNIQGHLGLNDAIKYSSPVQIPGTTWKDVYVNTYYSTYATKTDGTLWVWGYNAQGQLGQNNITAYSSPVQVGSDTTWDKIPNNGGEESIAHTSAIKTDGTLWVWGQNGYGQLGQNQAYAQLERVSSPIQIPGTWSDMAQGNASLRAVKTDGTLWAWGLNERGIFGTNQAHDVARSSPVQVPGTTWYSVTAGYNSTIGIKRI